MAGYHGDYIASINEVKLWLAHKSLDEFIYLLLDHGYDDLASIAECNDQELGELTELFSTFESKKSIQTLVETLRQVGIDVYRRQKSEFARLIDLDEQSKKQDAVAEQVSRVRGLSQAAAKSNLPPPSSASPLSPAPLGSIESATSPVSRSSSSSSFSPSSYGATKALKLPPPISAVISASAGTTTASGAAAASASSATGSAGVAALAANPTSVFDVDTWDGAVHFQAYLHSIQCYARAFDEPILPPSSLESKLLDGRSQVHLSKIKRFLSSLVCGSVFKKFKRGSSSKRLIWTSDQLDFVMWGTEDKSLVKGYLNTHDIQEINQGVAGKNKNRLYIVSPDRTLELEAKDSSQAVAWKEMLEFLIQLNMSELEQKKLLQTGAGAAPFQAKYAKTRAEYTKLLSTGSVFKKWPGASKIGSVTTRLVWSPLAVDRMQWGDLMTKKVMGFVLMQDIVEVREHPDDKLKFIVYALKRSLELEARNETTRDRWIKGIRFFIEFHNFTPNKQ